MSVRLSVCQPRLWGNVIFSTLIQLLLQFFFVQIPLINEHLFCKYFVRLSVGNATKGFVTYGCFHSYISLYPNSLSYSSVMMYKYVRTSL